MAFICRCGFERANVSIGPRSVPKINFPPFYKQSQVSETQKYWFAARTLSKQEFAVQKRIEKLSLEEKMDVECYLPTRTVVTQLKYRRKRNVVPVARGLIFIHATKQLACDLHNIYGVQVFYMKDLSTHSMLVVPDKQMQDFMFVMDLKPDGVCFDNEPLTIGQKVTVVKGEFSGIEGEISTEANKTYVVIRITGVLVASIKVPKSYLKVIKDQ